MEPSNEGKLRMQIDEMTYEEMLRLWRFAPSGNRFFIGEVGKYYESVMKRKREALGPEEHARISMKIGWR